MSLLTSLLCTGNGGGGIDAASQQVINSVASSGYLTQDGGGATTNYLSDDGSGQAINILSGSVIIVDRSDPEVLAGNSPPIRVTWNAGVSVDVTGIAPGGNGLVTVSVDKTGSFVLQSSSTSFLPSSEQRDKAQLGVVSLVGDNITSIANAGLPAFGVSERLYDLATSIGPINSNANPYRFFPSVLGTALQYGITAGSAFAILGGSGINVLEDSLVTQPETDPSLALALILSTGAFSFSPTNEEDTVNYESSPGVLTPLGNNRAQIKRGFYFRN